jgi:hypothetical protein
MATSYPGGLDAFSNPAGTDELNNADPALRHSLQHSNANDAIEALQTKVGVDGATPTYVPPGATAGTRINAAIASLPSGGGAVQLGAGTYTIDTAVLIDRPLTLRGVGIGTLLSFDASAVSTAIRMADTTQRQVFLSDFRINTTTGSDNTGRAIDASYFFNSTIERITIGSSSTQTPQVGISFDTLGTYYNAVENCRIQVGGVGSIGIRGTNNANDNAVRSCKILGDAQTTAVQLSTAHSWVLEHVSCDTAGMAIGADINTDAHDTTIIGCYFEGMDIGLRVAASVESCRFIGGYISTSGTANIQDNGAIGLTIDNSWVQFEPYSSIDRPGTVRNRINGFSVPSNDFVPEDMSFLAWTYDPVGMQSAVTAPNGDVLLARIRVRYPITITNLGVYLAAGATTPTANQNYLGLYNAAGTRVAVTAAGALDAPSATSGFKSVALTAPYVAVAGWYWVALLLNAATPATVQRANNNLNSSQPGLSGATARYARNGTGATSLPASIVPASNSSTGAVTFWAAAL